jgi:hypothetical protein
MTTQPQPGTKLEHVEGEIFHLFTEARESADSVIPIRWCICPEALKKFKEQEAKNLHMLIVTTNEKSQEKRYLLPIEKTMTYISFSSPGKHIILATIVWCPDRDIEQMQRFFLRRYSVHRYHNYIVEEYERKELKKEGSLNESSFYSFDDIGRESLEVNVPAEFFAKEPPKWIKEWANMLYETEPMDQCQFRRRCILAFTIQPPIMLLYAIAIILIRVAITAFLLSIGKGVNIRPIANPLKQDHDDIYINTSTSIFRSYLWWPLIPLPWIILIASATITRHFCAGFPIPTISTIHFIGLAILTAIASIASILAIEFILLMIAKFTLIIFEATMSSKKKKDFNKWLRKHSRERNERKYAAKTQERTMAEQKKRAAFELVYHEYEELSCPGTVQEANISALPKHRRTIYLRFQNFKRKVCKPFSN